MKNLGVIRLIAAMQAAAPPLVAQLAVSETSLGVRPAGMVPHTISVSATLRLAYVVETHTGDFVVVDGVRGQHYSDINARRIIDGGSRPYIEFSPDGKRFGYPAKRGTSTVVVVDGVEGPRFDHVDWHPMLFSPDSRHFAYAAKRGTRHVAVFDGRVGRAFDEVSPPTFTADGREFLYVARRNGQDLLVRNETPVATAEQVLIKPMLSWITPPTNGNYHRVAYALKNGDSVTVVVDSVRGKAYRSVGNWVHFSRDGRRVMYVARDSLYHIVVDGVEGPGYAFIAEGGSGFSEDGEHYAYVAQVGGKMAWVVDGKEQTLHDRLATSFSPRQFAPGSSRLTYPAWTGGQWFAVLGDRETARFDYVFDTHYLPGGRVLYRASRGGREFFGVDTAVFEFDQVAHFAVTPAGRIAISARRGSEWGVFVDGVRVGAAGDAPGYVVPSPDGQRLAVLTHHTDKWRMSLDGATVKEYEDIQLPQFSSDGRHLTYIARRLDKWVIVIDGAESRTYDEILFHRLETAESWTVLARRGRQDFRVTIPWQRKR